MKIKTKVLTGFLKKIKMDAEQQIIECVLKFEKDGLKIDANSAPKQSRIMGWLKTNGFKEYEELGNIGINDLGAIINVLERFGEIIKISKEGNLMTINGDNKKVDIELISENFLVTDTGQPDLKFIDTISITATKLKDIFKDVQMNKDATLTIETEKKKTKFSNTGKYKFLTTLDSPSCKGGAKTTFGQPFISATAGLDGNLEISIGKDYPAKVIEKTETSVVTIIIAPRVED